MKRILKICLVNLFCLSVMLPAWAKTFQDVGYKNPTYDAVHVLTEYKFMEPLTYNEFKGELKFTRFHLAESLHAMLGNRYVPETEVIILTDVSPNSKRYPIVLKVLRAKLMNLEDNGDFNGLRPVTRYELADSLLNLLKFSGIDPPLPLAEERKFKDVDPAYDQIVKAVTNTWQLTAGYPDGKFRGSKEITRFEATFMLARAASQIYEDFKADLAKGGPQPSVEQLVTSDPSTPNSNNTSGNNDVDSLQALKNALDQMEGKNTSPPASAAPSAKPTTPPTTQPTAKPTAQPTAKPSVTPTAKPSPKPSAKPTAQPTRKPSPLPSNEALSDLEKALKNLETTRPSAKPTASPTPKPSAKPTAKPSAKPTAKPSAKPTPKPSIKPENLQALDNLFASPKPSVTPSAKPSAKPTPKPTAKPSAKPTSKPSAKPTPAPTAKPSTRPSARPVPQATPAPKASEAESLSDLEKRLRELREAKNTPSVRPSARPTPKPEQPDSLVDIPLPSARPSTPPSTAPTPKPTEKPITRNKDELPPPLRSRILLFGNYRLLYEEVVPANIKQELGMPDSLQNVSGDAGISAHLNSLFWFGEPNTTWGNLGLALDVSSQGGYSFDGVDMTDLIWTDMALMYRLFGNSSFDIAAGLDGYFRFTSSSNDPRNNYFQAARTYIGVGTRLSMAYRLLDWWTLELNLAPHYVMQDLSNIAISSVPLNRWDTQITFFSRFDIWSIGESKLSLDLGYKGQLMFDLGSDASQMMHGVVFGTGYHF